MSKKNVLGTDLELCCLNPKTGYFRDGYCRTDSSDYGQHTICAQVTKEFLEFTKKQGNDLSQKNEDFNFPGLKAGDRWCLCANRWKESLDAQVAPPIILNACDESVLKIIPLEVLKQYEL